MVDGCGEFLVAGEEDTLDALKYAPITVTVTSTEMKLMITIIKSFPPLSTTIQTLLSSSSLISTTTTSYRLPLALPVASSGGQDLEKMLLPPLPGFGSGRLCSSRHTIGSLVFVFNFRV